MKLLEKNIRPRDIVTKKSLENAAVVVAASGGSTNAALHLPAIANEAGIRFTLEDVTKISKRQMGTKIYGGESSHLPLKINTAGVIPAIFASALLLLPITFSNFGFSESETFIDFSSLFSQGKPLYMLLYASGIIFFSFRHPT